MLVNIEMQNTVCAKKKKKKKKKLQKMIKGANVNIVNIGYVNMLKYEEEYVTLLTDMQKLIINIRKIMIKIKYHQVVNIGT